MRARELGMRTGLLVLGLCLALVPAGVARWLIVAAADVHWGLEIGAVLLAAAAAVGLFLWIRKAKLTSSGFGMYPRIGLTTNLVGAAVLATVVMGSLTGLLYRFGLVTYEPMPDDAAKLLDFYSWHLIESVPIFKVWTALDIPPPMKTADRLSGILLFLYQTLVVAVAIDIYRSKRLSIDDQLAESRALRVMKKPKDARRSAELALRAADRRGSAVQRVDARIELAESLLEAGGTKEEVDELVRDAGEAIAREADRLDLDKRRAQLAAVAARP